MDLIASELLAGVFMPLRFIVYRRAGAGADHISFLRPTAFARPFDSAKLTEVATALERDMNDVLEELDF